MRRSVASSLSRSLAACIAVVILTVGIVLYLRRPAPPPAPTANPVTIAKFAATPAFVDMPDEQKAQYLAALRSNMKTLVDAAHKGEISRDERRAALRNGFRLGARLEMSRYFTLPAGAARKAHLDRLINEQEQLRQYASQFPGGDMPRLGGNPVELKQFIESLAPEDRIHMAQFAFDLFQRRRERNLPVWPFGPGDPKS